MDFLTLGFLVLIVLASGGIAVFADWLGRKLGKKRLTILHLRPKTTAQIGTFTSGIVISSVTILLLYTISSDVRLWIQEGRRAITEVVQIRAQRDSLKSDYERTKNTRDALAKDVGILGRQADVLRKLAESRKTLIAEQERTISSQKRRVGQLSSEAHALQATLHTIEANYAGVQQQLADAKDALAKTRQALVSLTKQRDAAKGERDNAIRQTNDLSAKSLEYENEITTLQKHQEELQTQVNDLDGQRIRLSKAAEDAKASLEATQAKLAKADGDLAAKISELADAEAKLDQANKALGMSFAASRVQPVIFGIGDEVTRLPVRANLSEEDALNAIRSLERAARSVALERGAKERGADYPAAGIYPRDDPKTGRTYTTDDLERELASRVAGKPEAQLLLAFSTINVFRGEPVSLEVAVAANPIVYKESEVVAWTLIEGRKDEAAILDEITAFIGTKVRESAQKANMVVRQGAPDSLGTISPGEIIKLVSRVKAMDRTVRLQAVATAETRAGDPLRLEFRIK